jgi:alkylhydroperoxidase family enzyme
MKPEARIPLVPSDTQDPTVKPMFDNVRSKGSEPLNIHRLLALAPKLYRVNQGMAQSLRYDAEVSRRYRELAILRACHNQGGEYEVLQHVSMAQAAGLSKEQVAAVPQWKASALFDARERALLAFVDALPNPKGVDSATFEEMARHFTTTEMLELTITATFYTAAAMMTNAFDLQSESWEGPRLYGTT